MPTATRIDPVEMSRLNNQNFTDLVSAITQLGFSLSATDRTDLRVFYETGTEKLSDTVDGEEYGDRLSYATGQLIDKIRYEGVQQAGLFSSFRDFLRSLCPIDPFC